MLSNGGARGGTRRRGAHWNGGCWRGDRRSGCVAVVAADADESCGELVESVAPGSESVADDAEGVADAAEGVATVMVGPVGVVVDGPEQAGGAGAGVPPGLEQGPGAPERHPAYPTAVQA